MSTSFRSYTHFAVRRQRANYLQMSATLLDKMFSTSVKTQLRHDPTLPEASLQQLVVSVASLLCWAKILFTLLFHFIMYLALIADKNMNMKAEYGHNCYLPFLVFFV